MKVRVISTDEKPVFPCLMQHGRGIIVLFHSERCGLVVKNNHDPIGEYREDWIMDSFEPFHGSVTLEND